MEHLTGTGFQGSNDWLQNQRQTLHRRLLKDKPGFTRQHAPHGFWEEVLGRIFGSDPVSRQLAIDEAILRLQTSIKNLAQDYLSLLPDWELDDLIQELNLAAIKKITNYRLGSLRAQPEKMVIYIHSCLRSRLFTLIRQGRRRPGLDYQPLADIRYRSPACYPLQTDTKLLALMIYRAISGQSASRQGFGLKLTKTQIVVLKLRLGLNGYEPHSQPEIAQLFGLSKARVSQIEAAALDKVRAQLHLLGLELPETASFEEAALLEEMLDPR